MVVRRQRCRDEVKDSPCLINSVKIAPQPGSQEKDEASDIFLVDQQPVVVKRRNDPGVHDHN